MDIIGILEVARPTEPPAASGTELKPRARALCRGAAPRCASSRPPPIRRPSPRRSTPTCSRPEGEAYERRRDRIRTGGGDQRNPLAVRRLVGNGPRRLSRLAGRGGGDGVVAGGHPPAPMATSSPGSARPSLRSCSSAPSPARPAGSDRRLRNAGPWAIALGLFLGLWEIVDRQDGPPAAALLPPRRHSSRSMPMTGHACSTAWAHRAGCWCAASLRGARRLLHRPRHGLAAPRRLLDPSGAAA